MRFGRVIPAICSRRDRHTLAPLLARSRLMTKIKIKIKIVYSVWQKGMLDSHNYDKIQIQIRQ